MISMVAAWLRGMCRNIWITYSRTLTLLATGRLQQTKLEKKGLEKMLPGDIICMSRYINMDVFVIELNDHLFSNL